MKILAFETSCDDTSIALFENEVLICMHTKSQIKIHNLTGGVVPEVASREHANVIFDVLAHVLSEANTELRDIDYIAVTTHPGLVPSLLTGITVASTLSETLQIPILPIDHIQAHIFSNFLERKESQISFPLVCLTVSGGHNEVYYMSDMWTRVKLGQTQDDAAGEAFDKVAKMMGLEYPGGPIISNLASQFTQEGKNLFPRVFLEKSAFGFSFSGLKSAVKREVDKRGVLTQDDKIELSFEFQSAVNEVLSYKLIEAAQQKGVSTVMLAGGVSANDDLNQRIQSSSQKLGLKFYAPVKKLYCMDNAAMIGILAYYKIKYGEFEHHIGSVEVGKW
ncbi:tRNA (adenosine(37)-N6)-threonylcarbamoyltransferase complex transferase subunit TsaD [Candidatus Gracilibacteria bacterium]|nr:tRNA (adenosine(37)-N6)-threonylcarbamoyltransferase complex transferase subunit TsaD [Candidatus Gracilibacteria bacterium]